DTAAPRENLSDEDEEESGQDEEEVDEDEDEEEAEEAPRRWQGIESILRPTRKWSIERQVLHSQCKRLEAQNYNLTRTAEQLSLTMGELVSQRQK
ncbi:hypothetical protein INR49_021579, partial [Caranx melampygus]